MAVVAACLADGLLPTRLRALALPVLCCLALFHLITFPAPPRSPLPAQPQRVHHHQPAARASSQRLCVHVVSNDLPPLFRRGRLVASLRFRFQHERRRTCTELYILDRLVEREDQGEVLRLLFERGLTSLDVVERSLASGEVSAQQLWDQAGALNLALEESKRRGSDWMVVLDPAVFVTWSAWTAMVSRMRNPQLDTVLMPTRRALAERVLVWVNSGRTTTQSTQLSRPCEIPQFAIRPSSTGPNPFRASPPGSFAFVLDFLTPRCKHLFTGKHHERCARTSKSVIRLFSYPATREMATLAVTPQQRRVAMALGTALLAAKARVIARMGQGIPPSADDLAAVEVVLRLELGSQLVGKTGSPPLRLSTATLRDIAGLRVADEIHEVRKWLVPPSTRPPRMMCGRVLGNDVPPLQMHGQTYTNLRYVLQHEAPQDCEHVFVVNRVMHEEMASKLVALLETNGYKVGNEILVREIDWSLPMKALDAKYIGDVNGARNLAWDEGIRRGAEWIDLVDGSEFGTRVLWEDTIRKIQDPYSYPMLLKAMVRLRKVQAPSWLNAETDVAQLAADRFVGNQEAQLVLPANSSFRFDPKLEYGNRNKLAVLLEECGSAYVRSNADLGDSSSCVVLEGTTFRLFPFRSPQDMHHRLARKQKRFGLRSQGKKLLLGAARYLWCQRNGTTPDAADERLYNVWRHHPSDVGWTDEGLQVPWRLSFVFNP